MRLRARRRRDGDAARRRRSDSRSGPLPAVSGGGDVVIASSTGELPSARWILSSGLRAGGFEGRVSAASPSRRATLYLVRDGGGAPDSRTGGIPSLERAISDPETSGSARGPMPFRMRRGPLRIPEPRSRRSIDFIPFRMFLRAPNHGPNGCISTATQETTAST